MKDKKFSYEKHMGIERFSIDGVSVSENTYNIKLARQRKRQVKRQVKKTSKKDIE